MRWIRGALLGAFVALASFAQDGKGPADLTKNRKIYLKGLTRIEAKHKSKVEELSKQHIRNLVKIKTYYAKKGNLDAALAVDAEIKTFKAAVESGEAVAVAPEQGDPKGDDSGRHVAGRKPGKPMSLAKLGLDLVAIKAGSFTTTRDKVGKCKVQLTRNYWMGKCEVTVSQYAAVLGRHHSNDLVANFPMANVTWYEAVEFCKKLTARERTARRLPKGYVYRLPTEAEWEYACFAGTETEYFFGDSKTSADDYSWTKGNANGVLHEVGKKKPNPWGLHDMYGNAAEWCHDFGDTENTTPREATDPTGPARGNTRVLQGGCITSNPGWLKRGYRKRDRPETKRGDRGFRVVLGPILN